MQENEPPLRIYRINADVNHFQDLLFDGQVYKSYADQLQVMEMLNLNGRPKRFWIPPTVFCLEPLLEEPDFWSAGGTGGFAATERALDLVRPHFERAGQLLELPYDKQILTVLNVTECINCVDEAKSIWSRGERHHTLRQPYFIPRHLVVSSVFKIPQNLTTIYCYEATGDPEDEFKACVELNQLRGLIFTEVWNSEVGILNPLQYQGMVVGRPPDLPPEESPFT